MQRGMLKNSEYREPCVCVCVCVCVCLFIAHLIITLSV